MNMWNENNFEVIKQSFLASPLFDVIRSSDQRFIAMRRSMIPGRGIFRLLIPRTRVVVTVNKNQYSAISVHPEPVAVFMLVMFLGGVVSEIFTDRAVYPRDYPPEFIYGLSVFYIGLLIIDIFYTRKQVSTLLNQPSHNMDT